MTRPSDEGRCDLCGEPMPEGESMFRMHGYSGPCPAPPLPKPPVINWELLGRKLEADLAEAKGTIERVRRERNEHSEWRQKLAIKLNDAKAALAAAQAERDALRADLAAAKAERDTFAEDNRRHTEATNRMMDELAAAKAERDALRAALKHQRMALCIVKERQGGYASIADLNQGIALIDDALAKGE